MFKLLLGLMIIGCISAKKIGEDDDLGVWSPYLQEDKKDDGKSTLETLSSEEDNYSKVIEAAIKTQRTHRVIPMKDIGEEVAPRVIKVESYQQPVKIIYKTESSPVSIQQVHKPSKATSEETSSQDEPHRVTHKVFRPVIQEIREVIQPYRRIKQEVRPVIEEVKTLVAKRDRSQESNGNSNSNSNSNKGQSKQKKEDDDDQADEYLKQLLKELTGTSQDKYSSDDDSSKSYKSSSSQSDSGSSYGKSSDNGRDSSYGKSSDNGRESSYGKSSDNGRDSSYGKSSDNGRESSYGKSSDNGRESSYGKSSDNGRESSYGKSSGNGRESLYGKSSDNGRDSLYGKSSNSRKESSETRKYNRKESSDEEKSQSRSKVLSMRAPILPLLYAEELKSESVDSYNEKSNSNSWKPALYQMDSKPSNRKSRDTKKTQILYADDIAAVLEQMTNLMGDQYTMRASQPTIVRANPPLMNLNASPIRLAKRRGKSMYTGDMDFAENYPRHSYYYF